MPKNSRLSRLPQKRLKNKMRHRVNKRKLGRQSAHRKATVTNLATAVLISQKIKTTKVKAKEARMLVDKLITIAKTDTLPNRRLIFSMLRNKKVTGNIFSEIAPRFKKRAGGYTRIIPLGFRRGDGADMVILELTEQKVVSKPKPKSKKEALRKDKPTAPKKEAAQPPVKEETGERKVAPKPKTQVAEEISKEKAKSEKKKIDKGFTKGLRRFFRRKSG